LVLAELALRRFVAGQTARLTALAEPRPASRCFNRLGVRASILDKLVEAERPDNEAKQGEGRKFELFEPEPWPEHASGPELTLGRALALRRIAEGRRFHR
jgi:hypothetical protein